MYPKPECVPQWSGVTDCMDMWWSSPSQVEASSPSFLWNLVHIYFHRVLFTKDHLCRVQQRHRKRGLVSISSLPPDFKGLSIVEFAIECTIVLQTQKVNFLKVTYNWGSIHIYCIITYFTIEQFSVVQSTVLLHFKLMFIFDVSSHRLHL